jgi:thiamine pyrophosphokinase
MEDLDTLTRRLLTKVREIKVDLITNDGKAKEDIEKALQLTDQIFAELYSLKLKIERQEVLR